MKKLELSIPSERLIGFTIPRDGHFHVCDHDEVWVVEIGPPLKVEETDILPYNFASESNDFIGWGSDRTHPILSHGDKAIGYDFDPKKDDLTLRYSNGDETHEIEFATFSGDWFTASFSRDGRYIVLAEPYCIAIYDVS